MQGEMAPGPATPPSLGSLGNNINMHRSFEMWGMPGRIVSCAVRTEKRERVILASSISEGLLGGTGGVTFQLSLKGQGWRCQRGFWAGDLSETERDTAFQAMMMHSGGLLSQEQRAQKQGSAKITEEARSQGTQEHCAETSCYYSVMRFQNQEMASSERHADGVNLFSVCLGRSGCMLINRTPCTHKVFVCGR